tara:strand:+ start:79 stop:330 length:252 start_codon:yes stop_codon:yes gene_type:complete
MQKFTFNTNDDNFKKIIIDLLVDILATNKDIIDRLDSVHDFSFDEGIPDSRIEVIQYLQEKHGELPEFLLDFLRTKGIDKPNK